MSDRRANIVSRVSENLQKFLRRDATQRLIVAYSGGLDSTVLLHIVKDLSMQWQCELLAVHINHRLHRDADDWAAHCRDQARSMGVAFQSLSVQVVHVHWQGLEAAARDARYKALQDTMRRGDLLLSAHHQDDQAETVLLQLLRGAGTQGLKAMGEYRALSKGLLVRPMLGIRRTEIYRYAQEKRLRCLDDPSNADPKYQRNYIRHRVGPALAARWPLWHDTVARSAMHQAAADTIVAAEGRRSMQRCLLPGSLNLSLRAFITLTTECQRLALRAWCQLNAIAPPNTIQTKQICQAIFNHIHYRNSRGSAIPYSVANKGIGIYRGTLRVINPLQRVLVSPILWLRGSDCVIPKFNLKLRRSELMRQAPALFEQNLRVEFRRGGERCACGTRHGEIFHKSLKNIFQTENVPVWQRERIPLIYAQRRLRLIWGIRRCD